MNDGEFLDCIKWLGIVDLSKDERTNLLEELCYRKSVKVCLEDLERRLKFIEGTYISK